MHERNWQLISEDRFQQFMEEIDCRLRAAEVPVPARELRAFEEAGKMLRTKLVIGPLPPGPAIADNFTGMNLSRRIRDWMQGRYGDKLKIDLSIGSTVVMLREEPWLIRLPRVFGRFAIVYDRDITKKYPHVSATPGVTVTINVLQRIEDLSPQLASSLSDEEIHAIAATFGPSMAAFGLFEELKDGHELLAAAQFDLRKAAEICVYNRRELGFSRWHSLQAVEKTLKRYIQVRGKEPPRHHDLAKLANLAGPDGHARPFRADLLTQVQCPADVRYSPQETTAKLAVASHRAAIELCADGAFAIKQAGPNRIIM